MRKIEQTNRPFDLILFDLGGVLVANEGPARLAQWLEGDNHGDLVDRWLTSTAVRAFERGAIHPEDFARQVVSEFSLRVQPDQFLEEFAHWVDHLYPGCERTIERLTPSYDLGCLSNTNPVHWRDGQAMVELCRPFKHRFVSFEIGELKPDPAIFEHVIATTGILPHKILFLDDSQRNIEGARACGLTAHRAVGLPDANRILTELDVWR